MNARWLAVAAAAGIILALVLSAVSGPRTTPADLPGPPAGREVVGREPSEHAAVRGPSVQASKSARRPAVPREVSDRGRAEVAEATRDPAEEVFQDDPEAMRAYRCRSLQEHANLTDKLITVASGNALPDEERAKMLPRVANLALKLHAAEQAVRSGELVCDDGGEVDLSASGAFLEKHLEAWSDLLEEKDLADVEKALAVIAADAGD